MSCPYIYIGLDSTQAPPTPFWANPAIVPPSDTLTVGTTVSINVTVQNTGDPSPPSTLELYWSDPTTGFMAVNLIGRIGDTSVWTVPFHTDLPPVDGSATTAFAWTPNAAALGTNGGHVCLLARTQFNTSPSNPSCPNVSWDPISPQTDPHSGIHNIQLVPAFGLHRKPHRFYFAFAATNSTKDGRPGLLHVRFLDPKVDEERARLEQVLFQPYIERRLCGRGRITAPKAVLLGAGRESLVMPQRLLVDATLRDQHVCVPRLGNLGRFTPEQAKALLAPGYRFEEATKPHTVDLAPAESRQIILELIGQEEGEHTYAVEVLHTTAEGKPIGGMTILFVDRCAL
jgi:hypothetical protein